MFERFTSSARAAVVAAYGAARELASPQIGTGHLLLGLLTEDPSVASDVLSERGVTSSVVRELLAQPGEDLTVSAEDADALRTIGIDVDRVLARMREVLGRSAGPDAAEAADSAHASASHRGRLRLTKNARKALQLALREAIRLGDRGIGVEHVLLGILRTGDGTAINVLRSLGVAPDELRQAVLEARTRAA